MMKEYEPQEIIPPPSHKYQKTLEKVFGGCANWNNCDECEDPICCETIWRVIYMWTEKRWGIALKFEDRK